MNQPQRGDQYAGGLFVGISRGGVVWVAYEPDDFAALCAVFDRAYRVEGGGA